MSFRNGAYVYSDFEPNEDFREIGTTVIANKIRVDDDEWIDEMVGQHADQFLQSIQQNKTHVSSRSPTRSRRSNNNSRSRSSRSRSISVQNAGDEERNDTMMRRDTRIVSQKRDRRIVSKKLPVAVLNSAVDSGNSIHNDSNQRDENENTNKPSNKINKETGEKARVADPRSTTVQHNYLSSTERSGSNASNYISSAESGGSGGAIETGISYDDSILSTESKALTRGQEIRLSFSSATQSILDDLQVMQARMQHPRSEDRLPTDLGRSDSNGGVYPERPLWKLLLERQWDWAQERVRLHPEEAKKYIRLPISPTDGIQVGADDKYLQHIEESENVHSALPLHLACSVRPLPPVAFVRDLIVAYPEACRRSQESSGFLPIHMASDLRTTVSIHTAFQGKGGKPTTGRTDRHRNGVRTGDDGRHRCKVDSSHQGDIIELLLASYPESIARQETTNGMTPLHIAASTTRAENGIVSPVASTVLTILMAKSSAYPATVRKDKNGLTPRDWAWQNTEFFCPRCGIQTTKTAKPSWAMNDDQEKALLKLNVGGNKCCTEPVAVHEKCLHPLLRREIRSHLAASSSSSSSSANRYKPEIGTARKDGKAKPERSRPKSPVKQKQPQQKDTGNNILSRRVLDDIREYTNHKRGRPVRQSADGKNHRGTRPEKTASLHLKIRLSDLLHPSNPGKRRGIHLKGCGVPSPYFEVFAAHRRGMSKTYYRSYPLHESDGGTWEEAFLDLGLTHAQLRNGTHGAGYIELGIRVMHCPGNGAGIKLIGTCQLSLEALQREQRERRQVLADIRRLRDVIDGDDDGRKVNVSLPEPEKHPILNGFRVTGNLQVLTLAIR